MAGPFAIKDCALIAIATGLRAMNLRELQHHLEEVHPGCIYYHFWGNLLQPRFEEAEFQNDFAAWSYNSLNDLNLAERLGIIDPTQFADLEDLRREVSDVIEERLDETEIVPSAKPDQQFHFLRSKIIVMDTKIRVNHPEELGELIGRLPPSSIFYHFIDARRRTLNGQDDFSSWVHTYGSGYSLLARQIADIDPYFVRLSVLRDKLAAAFSKWLPGKGER